MAETLTAKAICERALRKVQKFSINDDAARPRDLDEALHWLDMMLAHLSGTTVLSWLVPLTIAIPLTGGEGTIDLLDAMGDAAPTDGFLYPLNAMLQIGTNNRVPIDLITRRTFDSITNPDEAGQPTVIHIDRVIDNPTARFHPIPPVGQDDWVLYLTIQTLSPTVDRQTATPKAQGLGDVSPNLRATWNLWAVTRLSQLIGDGPVSRRPRTEIVDWKTYADELEDELLGFDNTEHETVPNQVQFRDF